MPDLAYVNGRVSALEDAVVSINDRGFTFADSVYDYVRTCNKKPFLLEEHLGRLSEACRALSISANEQLKKIPQIIEDLIERSSYTEQAIYIQISRGSHPRNIIFEEGLEPTLVVTVREFFDHAQQLRITGAPVILHPDIRWDRSGIKTSNLLGSSIAKNEAVKKGAKEAILFLPNGNITEACSSSVFIVKDGIAITPPCNSKIIAGVTREFTLSRVAPLCEIETKEQEITVNQLFSSDEVFIAATSLPILPIVKIDGKQIANGQPGSITRKLMNCFLEEMGKY